MTLTHAAVTGLAGAIISCPPILLGQAPLQGLHVYLQHEHGLEVKQDHDNSRSCIESMQGWFASRHTLHWLRLKQFGLSCAAAKVTSRTKPSLQIPALSDCLSRRCVRRNRQSNRQPQHAVSANMSLTEDHYLSCSTTLDLPVVHLQPHEHFQQQEAF